MVFFINHLQCGTARRCFRLFDASRELSEVTSSKGEVVPNIRTMFEARKRGRRYRELVRKFGVRTAPDSENAHKAVVSGGEAAVGEVHIEERIDD